MNGNMQQKRLIYAILLAVIYVTATSLSSISILTCDHHHHHVEHHNSGCDCCHDHNHGNDIAFAEKCCDHHHPVLGDNHTDFIASKDRSDSRASQLLVLMLSPVLVSEEYAAEDIYSPRLISLPPGDEDTPLLAALMEVRGLRAPPALA